MNHMMIAGHLGADPEVRFTSTGKKVTTLRVAANARKGNVDETIWWRVTIWGDQFDKLVSYLKKGSAVIAFGEMQKPELFTDREGKQQISLNLTASQIQFSPFGGKGERPVQEGGAQEPSPVAQQSYGAGSSTNFSAYGAQPVASLNKPSMPPFGQQASAQPAFGQSASSTFDDEIPF